MAHEVRVRIDTGIVAHKDLEILVREDGAKLGKVLISKGNIEWLPKGNSVNKRRLSWKQFSEFMDQHGRTVKAK